MSAELRGTKLFLRLAETDMPLMQKEESVPVHLVATADGIVESLVCRSGTPMVKIGDVVKKGDILVSGIVSVIGDNETLVNRYPVAADADILLKNVNLPGRKKRDMRFILEIKKYFRICLVIPIRIML